MIYAIVAVAVAVIVAFVMLGRMQSARKKEAIADLAREREELHTPDIIELVHEEVNDAGLGNLPGAEGIDPTVLLKAWKRDAAGCEKGRGQFILDDGIAPENATEGTVSFDCGPDTDAADET